MEKATPTTKPTDNPPQIITPPKESNFDGFAAKRGTLKTINVSGLDHLKNLKLICLLLQDEIPELHIDGLPMDREKLLKPSVVENV